MLINRTQPRVASTMATSQMKYDVLNRLRLDINFTKIEGIHFDDVKVFTDFLVASFLAHNEARTSPTREFIVDQIAIQILDEETDGKLYDAIVDNDDANMAQYMQLLRAYIMDNK